MSGYELQSRIKIYALLIFLLPAIQLGVNVFICAPVLFIALFVLANKSSILYAGYKTYASVFCVMAVLFFQKFDSIPDFQYANSLRDLRSYFGAIILAWLIERPQVVLSNESKNKLIKCAIVLLWGLLFALLMQFILLRVGVNPFLPANYFIKSDDYSLGATWYLQAIEHGNSFAGRLSASFSEPSYLGLIAITCQTICLMSGEKIFRLKALILALAISAIAQSGLGIAGNCLIYICAETYRKGKLIKNGVLAIIILAVLLYTAQYLGGRVQDIFNGVDESVNIRLVFPIKIIMDIFAHHWSGMGATVAPEYYAYFGMVGPYMDLPFHNGFFNILVSFGWFSVLYFCLVFKNVKFPLIVYMVILFMQNGSSFEFDKIFLAGFIVSLVNKQLNVENRQKNMIVPRQTYGFVD